MIAVDTNILIYAHREDSPFHTVAYRRVNELAEGVSLWAIPWPCIHEFLAIVTHPRAYVPPTPLARAIEQVNAWLEFTEPDSAYRNVDALVGAWRVIDERARGWP